MNCIHKILRPRSTISFCCIIENIFCDLFKLRKFHAYICASIAPAHKEQHTLTHICHRQRFGQLWFVCLWTWMRGCLCAYQIYYSMTVCVCECICVWESGHLTMDWCRGRVPARHRPFFPHSKSIPMLQCVHVGKYYFTVRTADPSSKSYAPKCIGYGSAWWWVMGF